MGKKKKHIVVFDKKNALFLLGVIFPASLGIGWLSGDIFVSMFSDEPLIWFHWAAAFAMFTPLIFFPFMVLVGWKLRTGGVMPFSVELALVRVMVFIFAVAFVVNICAGAWFLMTIKGRGYVYCKEDVKPLGTSHYAVDKQFCPE